jgi:hypothetical protein
MKKVLIFVVLVLVEFHSIAQRIDNIEVKNDTTQIVGTWEGVKKYSSTKGDRWRMPTYQELKLIYNNKNLFPFILNKIYFSSSSGIKIENIILNDCFVY